MMGKWRPLEARALATHRQGSWGLRGCTSGLPDSQGQVHWGKAGALLSVSFTVLTKEGWL